MSTVGKSQNAAWQNLLDTQGLSDAAPILEEYGLSCESHISMVDEEDLVVLCTKLRPFQNKILRKWVQELGAAKRAAAFMKDASTAKKVEEENGDEDEDADADSDEEDEEAHGGAAGEQGAGDSKSDEDVRLVGEKRNVSSACSMPLLERIRRLLLETTLSWQCSSVQQTQSLR